MKVIISDDYQDCIRTLDCHPALSDQFELEIHHDTVTSLEAQAERFADADALLLVRERAPVGADLLARLPKLKYISQTGRAANHVDLTACTHLGCSRGSSKFECGAAHAGIYLHRLNAFERHVVIVREDHLVGDVRVRFVHRS